MPFPRRPLLLCLLPPPLLLLALLAASASVSAAPQAGLLGQLRAPPSPPQPRSDRGHRNDDALSDSVRRIERSTRGQVLSAERVPYDGRNVNRIKVVDDQGRVRVYMDDPQPQTSSTEPPPTRGDDD